MDKDLLLTNGQLRLLFVLYAQPRKGYDVTVFDELDLKILVSANYIEHMGGHWYRITMSGVAALRTLMPEAVLIVDNYQMCYESRTDALHLVPELVDALRTLQGDTSLPEEKHLSGEEIAEVRAWANEWLEGPAKS